MSNTTKTYVVDGELSRRCTLCKKILPLESFHKTRKTSTGRVPRCKSCAVISRNDDNIFQHKYGISLQQYNNMFEEQGQVCALCGNPESTVHHTGKIRRLAVDHDHSSGRVRALLCVPCNLKVGSVEVNKELYLKIFNYLDQHKQL